MSSRPLAFLSARPEQDAAEDEYRAFLAASALEPGRLHRIDLVRAPLPPGALERYAGFIGGGSPFNVGDPEGSKPEVQRRVERDLERIAAAAISGSTAALLTCYGIGVATRLLGGRIASAHGEPTGTTEVQLTEAGRADPLLARLPDRVTVFTAHKEGAAEAPAGATLLAVNASCPVQAYRAGVALWTTQFHPELTADAFVTRIGVYRDGGYFPPDEYEAVVARVRASRVTEPSDILRSFAARALATGAEPGF